jgi:hypothetical protein
MPYSDEQWVDGKLVKKPKFDVMSGLGNPEPEKLATKTTKFPTTPYESVAPDQNVAKKIVTVKIQGLLDLPADVQTALDEGKVVMFTITKASGGEFVVQETEIEKAE